MNSNNTVNNIKNKYRNEIISSTTPPITQTCRLLVISQSSLDVFRRYVKIFLFSRYYFLRCCVR